MTSSKRGSRAGARETSGCAGRQQGSAVAHWESGVVRGLLFSTWWAAVEESHRLYPPASTSKQLLATRSPFPPPASHLPPMLLSRLPSAGLLSYPVPIRRLPHTPLQWVPLQTATSNLPVLKPNYRVRNTVPPCHQQRASHPPDRRRAPAGADPQRHAGRAAAGPPRVPHLRIRGRRRGQVRPAWRVEHSKGRRCPSNASWAATSRGCC